MRCDGICVESVPSGGRMVGLSKSLCIALAFAATAPVLAAEGGFRGVPSEPNSQLKDGGYSFQFTGSFESVKSPDKTALRISRLNRVLWERSFERGSNGSLSAAVMPPQTAEMGWGHHKVAYGIGNWTVLSNSIDGDAQDGLYRKPGIGACLLAALAFTALAVSRRRAGYHPIVPPGAMVEARASVNGAR